MHKHGGKGSRHRSKRVFLICVTRISISSISTVYLNEYPVESNKSNKRHQPIGIGIQGLADCFFFFFSMMDMSHGDERSRLLNKQVFETIYFSALSESKRMSMQDGPYETFAGSLLSKGEFRFGAGETRLNYDWSTLRKSIMTHGVRNSLLVAPMPTASTSQILGNTESFEPITSNLRIRLCQQAATKAVARLRPVEQAHAGEDHGQWLHPAHPGDRAGVL